jgi:hypothetical protein
MCPNTGNTRDDNINQCGNNSELVGGNKCRNPLYLEIKNMTMVPMVY